VSAPGRVEGGCGTYDLETCDHFNKYLILQPHFQLILIAHDPHISLEDINSISGILEIFYKFTIDFAIDTVSKWAI
jgi:hypothetical protein